MTDGSIPEIDMARVPGMAAAQRRLARLAVDTVDMSYCEHGHGCEGVAVVAGVPRTFSVHAAVSPVAAVDDLAEQIEQARRAARRRRGRR